MIAGSKTAFYLNALSSLEKRELDDLVSSPYFNKNKVLVKLYRELIKAKITDDRKIYEKISGKKYEQQKLRYLLSDLNLLIEDFIALKKWNKDQFLRRQLLIEGLQERMLLKYVPQHQ